MKRGFTHQNLLARLTVSALFAVLFSIAAFAQSAAQQLPAPKVNLIIERNLLRFETPGEVRLWRVEIFNQTGELVYASGQVNASALEWPLQDQLDKPLAGGLYAYTLTALNEQGETVWTQRGHVIVDRASASDRIWVVSGNTIGVGSASELTVAGSPEATIGGAKLMDVTAPTRAEGRERSADATRATTASTDVQQITPGVQNAIGVVTANGTAGRIAKFIGANAIDDSVMTETNGRIGVNFAAAPQGRLHVQEAVGPAGVFAKNITTQTIPAFAGAVGVHGESAGSASVGVRGVSSGGGSIGVSGSALSIGVSGSGAIGVSGNSTSGIGVRGVTTSASLNDIGVHGRNDGAGNGVLGEAQSGTGVAGLSDSGFGVVGSTGGGSIVAGVSGFTNTANGRGVIGRANTGASARGVTGESTNGTGVYGSSTNNTGSAGVYGTSVDGVGVRAYSENYIGLRAESGCAFCNPSFLAGYFVGNVSVTGTLDAAAVAGNFASKMDHPLDPANKYLNQSFIEAPEMMSVQTGNVTTDANGEATVTLPDYFPAMSGDFRYQLTVVGQFAQAIVARKIEGNRFTIKTDKPNVEVSWQVTGLRQDAAAQANRKPVEETKPEAERGHYLRPALFNQPEEKSIEWARHPEMMKGMKAERATQQKASLRQ